MLAEKTKLFFISCLLDSKGFINLETFAQILNFIFACFLHHLLPACPALTRPTDQDNRECQVAMLQKNPSWLSV